MIAWRNQISLSLFGFSIISSRRSTLSGALALALTRSSVLHRGWQQQPHNYNEAGLMWWQDRLPALLSLSFVLGLHGVPPPPHPCSYHHVRVPVLALSTPRQNTPLFTSAYRGQQAFKLPGTKHFLLLQFAKKALLNGPEALSTFSFSYRLYTFTWSATASSMPKNTSEARGHLACTASIIYGS